MLSQLAQCIDLVTLGCADGKRGSAKSGAYGEGPEKLSFQQVASQHWVLAPVHLRG